MEHETTRLSLEEVAQALETTPLNVLMHVKRGLLEGVEEEDGWRIGAASLQRFIARNGGRKEATVCASGCSHAAGCGGKCS